ncbi:MexH family multidrug efflux RND transporter periplasmic adaptor subunit [Iodidimonas nitroreducens]|uniref:MexH family multidrug efflux RND transporter periplasmic adaptor subunit n=1 Tax=Iodidimonas nitroreducens TaxID=1236968 RepID=A0A5A7N8U7_9PROT|nr:efflux RND transporter periplasmic adaptor subunit [Iodidimonas nitroreducens]GAK32583.1 multidrug resistance protein MdtA [alpha proteobacterium Q-1]GER04518.1 MexH family multidrug efflux RND transporter periplasmic adaptor subunit [Iodidimonas nitroreducens]
MTRFASVFLTLISLAILGGGAFLMFYEQTPADGRGFGDRAVAVGVATVSTHPFADRIEAIGTTQANESVVINARVADTVESVNFNDGDIVEEGDILVTLNRSEQEALLAVSQSTLNEARQQLDRTRDLVERGNASRAVLDERVRIVETAKAQVDAAQSRIADRIVRAPFDGILGLRQVSPGTYLTSGTPITTLDDVTPIKLDFAVPERFLASLKAGQTVVARAAAFPDEDFAGKVITVNSRVDPVTRAVTVRAEIPNEDKRLRPGMMMTIDVISRERETLAVPEGAVVPFGQDQFVYVINNENIAERREIKIGLRRPGVVEVLSGVKAGEKVVVSGTMRLRPGMPVKINETASPASRPQA